MSKQRYEREIEEILSKYDQEKAANERKPGNDPPPPVDLRAGGYRPNPSSRNRPSMPNWKRLSSGQYMLAAFGMAVLALVVGRVSSPLAGFLAILAIVLFVVPILLYNTTGTSSGGYSPRDEKRWRGQPIDIRTRRNINDDPFAAIKRWLKRR